jgi:hypothetical protein
MNGGVILENGQVVSIFIEDTRQLMTAGDIIAQYGSPDHIVAHTEGVEAVFFWVRMLYPERGLGFIAQGLFQPNRENCLDSDSPISFFRMTSPGTMDDFIVQVYDRESQREWVRDRLVPWPGFGCEGFADP